MGHAGSGWHGSELGVPALDGWVARLLLYFFACLLDSDSIFGLERCIVLYRASMAPKGMRLAFFQSTQSSIPEKQSFQLFSLCISAELYSLGFRVCAGRILNMIWVR